MKSKNIIILALSIMAILYAINLLTEKNNTTFKNPFVVNDTASVQRIFMADKQNSSVDLKRDGNRWVLNGNEKPIQENVQIILKTLLSIEIKNPIAKSAYNNAVTQLATNSVKVEIYQTKYRINFAGIKLFKHLEKTHVFYVGGPTANNMGTVMKADGEDNIYVTYIPGFRGYLTERFKAKRADWLSHEVFSYNIMDMNKVRVEFPRKAYESYEIINNGDRSFKLVQLINNKELAQFDTLRVLEELAAFTKINYEQLLDNMDDKALDSIQQTLPVRIVTVETKLGAKRKLSMYYRPNFDNKEDMNGKLFVHDVDRLYGFIDKNKEPVTVQYFVIDNISRPLSFLVKASKNLPVNQENTNP